MNLKTQVLINGQNIDIYGDESINIVYSIADIRDINNRNTVYSKQIKLPATKGNNQIFNSIFEIGSDSSFNPAKKASCEIIVDSITVLNGYFQLTDIVHNLSNENIEYQGTCFASSFDFLKQLGVKEISNLDFSDLSYNYLKDEIKNSWTGNTDYVCPLIDYGKGWKEPTIQTGTTSGGNPVLDSDFYPCIRVKSIVDRIFSPTNLTANTYTYKSNFFNSTDFKNLIITPNLQGEKADYAVEVHYGWGHPSWDVVSIYVTTELICVRNGNEIIVATDGTKTYNCYNVGSGSSNLSGTAHVFPGDQYYVRLSGHYFVTGNGTLATGDINLNTISTFKFDYEDSVANSFYVSNTAQTVVTLFNPGMTYIHFPYTDKTTFPFYDNSNTFSTTTFIHTPVLGYSTFLPQKIKQTDFLLSLCQMFNLYIEEDKSNTNVLLIEPRDDYYRLNKTYKDWNSKIDISKPIEIKLLSELQSKNILFSYRDDGDFLNSDYKRKTKYTYGSNLQTFDNDYLTNTLNVQPIFSPTPLQNISLNSEVIIPRIYALDKTPGSLPQPTTFNTRILYYGGLLNISQARNKWLLQYSDGTKESLTKYPYAGNFDNPNKPRIDLNFGDPNFIYYYNSNNNTGSTATNLYETYWSNYVDEISDKNSKLITAYFNLSPSDIALIKFNDTIFWNENYFHINSIEYNALGIETTKVELIKINNLTVKQKTRYHAIHIGTNTTYIDVDLWNASISVNGYNNQLSQRMSSLNVNGNNNVTLGDGSNIALNGNFNFIDNNSNGIYIQGDLNTVAGGSNISIINGSGNTIWQEINFPADSGLTNPNNITLIGINDYSGVTVPNTVYVPNININGVNLTTDIIQVVDASSSPVSYYLPAISSVQIGQRYIIKATSVLSGVTVYTIAPDTIDGQTAFIYIADGQSMVFQATSNETLPATYEWKIVYSYIPELLNPFDTNNEYFVFTFDSIPKYIGGIVQYGALVFNAPDDGATWELEDAEITGLNVGSIYNPISCGGGGSTSTGFIPNLIYGINNSGLLWTVDLGIKPYLPVTFNDDRTHLTSPNYACSGTYNGFAVLNIKRNGIIQERKYISYLMDLEPLV